MIRPAQYRADPAHFVAAPKKKCGNPRLIPADVRHKIFGLMKLQREAEKEIDKTMDAAGVGRVGRRRTDLLRRIWREKGA